MCPAFILRMGLAAFRGPLLFPLYPIFREVACTSESITSPKFDSGVGLTHSIVYVCDSAHAPVKSAEVVPFCQNSMLESL